MILSVNRKNIFNHKIKGIGGPVNRYRPLEYLVWLLWQKGLIHLRPSSRGAPVGRGGGWGSSYATELVTDGVPCYAYAPLVFTWSPLLLVVS